MVDLYPVPIRIIPSERPTPQPVPPATIQRWARATGNPNAHRRDVAGITVPGIRPDTRDIQFARRFREGGRQFQYRAGALTIRTWNQIYISNRLSACKQRIWSAHEMDHVHDYEQLAGTLMLRLQSAPFMREFFIQRQWYNEDPATITQIAGRFESTCAQLFQQLTAQAARRRDTAAEYERIRARIRQTCTGRLRRPSRRAGAR